MKFNIHVLLKYIIHLNIVISTSAGLLSAGVAHLLRIENYSYYGFFGLFSTLCVYNFQRLLKTNSGKLTPWLEWVRYHKILVVMVSVISGLAAVYYFIRLINGFSLTLFTLISVSTIISYFYVVRIGRKSIRELQYLKIHAIAIVWTLIIIILPIINEKIFSWEIVFIFIPAHYIYFLAIAIPFDIRDLKYDSIEQRTIPQILGIRKAKLVSILMLIVMIIGMSYIYSNMLMSIKLMIVIGIQILLVAFASESKSEIYYSCFIDGSIMLLSLCYLDVI